MSFCLQPTCLLSSEILCGFFKGAKQAIEIAIKGKEENFGTIQGIGVSGQQHGCVVLDKKGQVRIFCLLPCMLC